jgi:RNA recognition motif-containing protein
MDRISLLMCNIGDRTDRRNLREAFERYGHVKDVYIPTDFHTK